MSDVTLIAYDIDAERLAKFCETTGATSTATADDLIEKSDAVDICVPTHLHLELASKCLNAGKPTLCEKPLARTVADCAKLVELSERTGVPLMPAQVVRYFPEFKKAHEVITSGGIGDPSVARTRRGGAFPGGAGGWFGDVELSGGAILDVAIHDFDWLRWTLGEVKRVYANCVAISGAKNMDYALTTMTFDSGALAHVEATWADPAGFRVTFEVAGSAGFIEHDTRLYPCLRTSTANGSVTESPVVQGDDPYYCEIRGFLDALDAGGPMPVTAIDGLKAVAICEAALESAKTGKPVAPSQG